MIIRSHGVPRSVYDELERAASRLPRCHLPLCAEDPEHCRTGRPKGAVLLVAGDKTHPEVQGIVGHTRGEVFVFAIWTS